QQPFQELQRAIQDRDRAIQEAYDLRQKLSDITRVINGQGLAHAYPSSGHIISSSSNINNNQDHLMVEQMAMEDLPRKPAHTISDKLHSRTQASQVPQVTQPHKVARKTREAPLSGLFSIKIRAIGLV
ncbi:hypothetical protein KC324_g20836, partial [Hortaea werneckii]